MIRGTLLTVIRGRADCEALVSGALSGAGKVCDGSQQGTDDYDSVECTVYCYGGPYPFAVAIAGPGEWVGDTSFVSLGGKSSMSVLMFIYESGSPQQTFS